MSRAVFPLWVFAVVALLIALIALALAQIVPGSGMMFVVGATILWMAFVQIRGRRGRN